VHAFSLAAVAVQNACLLGSTLVMRTGTSFISRLKDCVSARQPGVVAQLVGLWTRLVEGGLRSSLLAGRRGRCTKSPPQLGQISLSLSVAQAVQKVHSKEQIRASVESDGRSLSQHSQDGRSSSTAKSLI
tara:strand:- start:66 stop:455 length:390 start_codon:yes stop_codon:yes gene_type:complete